MSWIKREPRPARAERLSPVLRLAMLLLVLMPAAHAADLQRGVEFVKLRLYPQAAETFSAILSQNPTDTAARFQLANVYKLQDELALAVETFNGLLAALESRNPDPAASGDARLYGLTHLALSEIYCQRSELATAEQHARQAVRSCPTDADTHYRLGYIYTHQAKFDAARAAFTQTLSHNPDFAEVYEWLGLIALMEQQPARAVTYYRKVIEKTPYVQSAYYNLSKAYRLLGDVDAATENLRLFQQMKTYYDRTYAIESALNADPLNTALRLKLADIHLEQNHIAAAVRSYQALIQVKPEFVGGYDKLGRLYMNLKMHRRAVPMFQKVLALNPESVEAHLRLGWLYTALEMFDTAETHLQAALARMPELTLAAHGLAEIYTKQGRVQQAIQVYRHITTVAPDDADARKALHDLERLQSTSVP